jgi:Na+/phosphate symporter
MDAIETVAISKAVSKEAYQEASKKLTPGKYQKTFMARVSVDLKKGTDYVQNIAAKADSWLLLAVMMSKQNAETLEKLVREAEDMTEEAKEALKEQVKASAEKAMAEIKAKTATTCAGKITGSVEVEIVPTLEVK